MQHDGQTAVRIVRKWQDAANEQDVNRLLELSAPDVEIIGPRGSVRGRDVLRDWLLRAGLRTETLRTFARGKAVVVSQHGAWRSQGTGEVTGEADFATRFVLANDRVAELARYDGDGGLDVALEEAGLGYEDEV